MQIGASLLMTLTEAVTFVMTRGVVLEAGTGPVPSLAEAVAGGKIRGSWWAHPQGRQIYAVTRAIRDCPDVLVCRLVGGKITYVHRRLWPALVRVAKRFPAANLAQIHEVHTASGRHVNQEIQFPDWVPGAVATQALTLDEQRAVSLLGSWSEEVNPLRGAVRRKKPIA
jgi:hypothetical protein